MPNDGRVDKENMQTERNITVCPCKESRDFHFLHQLSAERADKTAGIYGTADLQCAGSNDRRAV